METERVLVEAEFSRVFVVVPVGEGRAEEAIERVIERLTVNMVVY